MYDLVSIIVPVYNVEQYLERCLNSLVRQTYPNIEILLVDDGSTDGSGALCDVWQSRDSRIRAFHKTNGGLSDARNYGLERASGSYVCFIDSDDWCDLKFIEVMLGALLDTGADLAECDYVCTDGGEPAHAQTNYEYSVFTGRECFLRFLTGDFFVSVWNKLYRRSLLEKQLFRKGVFHEDEFWTHKVFHRARKVCRLKYTGYYYYQRQGSIVHTRPSHKRLYDAFAAAKEKIAFIELNYPEYASIGYSKMMYTCMYLYSQARRGDFPEKPALQEELLSCFRIIFTKYLKQRQYRKEMWRFCFFRLFPRRYCALNR
ncbi:MAG: glycosyltransferase family 2 protein [Oscillospiraceae bacterium]|nr:glycosyltransferase family 2 protein [Oscillospiraceae bacterium]